MTSSQAFSDIEVSESHPCEYNHDASINMVSCDINSLKDVDLTDRTVMQLEKD